MKINQAKYELNDKDLFFDFDEWAALFKADPEAFNLRCLKWNQSIINSAPDIYQRRLKGLLFQINMEKARSKNALDSCMRISGMMWETFHQLKFELKQLDHNHSISRKPPPEQTINQTGSARILVFPTTEKARKNQ